MGRVLGTSGSSYQMTKAWWGSGRSEEAKGSYSGVLGSGVYGMMSSLSKTTGGSVMSIPIGSLLFVKL